MGVSWWEQPGVILMVQSSMRSRGCSTRMVNVSGIGAVITRWLVSLQINAPEQKEGLPEVILYLLSVAGSQCSRFDVPSLGLTLPGRP